MPTLAPFAAPRTVPPDRRPEPLPFEAIIFDVDGTLAETEEAHRTAFNQAFAEAKLGWHWSIDDYRALLGTTGGRERIARYLGERNLAPDASLIKTLHERKNAIYGQIVASGEIGPRPGIVDLIDTARERGIALAIATTTSRTNCSLLLAHVFGATALDWFSRIVTGEDVVAKKPSPEAYQRVLAGLGRNAQACLAIEDSRNGLLAARAAGLFTVVMPSRYFCHEDLSEASLLVAKDDDDGSGGIDLVTLQACFDELVT